MSAPRPSGRVRVVGADFRVQVYGFGATMKALREVAPDLKRELDRELREILAPVQSAARSLVPASPPLGRWNQSVNAPGSRPSTSAWGRRWPYDRLAWDSGAVRGGIRTTTTGGYERGSAFRTAIALLNANAAGAVYELMGSGKSRAPMIGNVRVRHGSSKRLIWKAWDATGAARWAPQRALDTIQAYEARLQARLESAGGAG